MNKLQKLSREIVREEPASGSGSASWLDNLVELRVKLLRLDRKLSARIEAEASEPEADRR